MMNLANQLTGSRILLAIFFIYIVYQPGLGAASAALGIFALASATDYLDGFVARRFHMENDLGKIMDPIADKFLVLSAFIVFVQMNLIDTWMVMVILAREILVTGLRMFALTQKKILAAEQAGKHKTVSQMIAIFVILGFIVFQRWAMESSGWSSVVEAWWQAGITAVMAVTVVLTIISGGSYVWNNRHLVLGENIHER